MDNLRAQTSPVTKARDFFVIVQNYKLRWLLPAIAISGAVAAYALTRPETWEVSQGVMVRNNAVAKDTEPGEFNSTDPMRRTEDTIVEVCTSARVLAESLQTVGPPDDWSEPSSAWPSEKAVESLRRAMSIEAPNGAEFGTTEVFYVKLKGEHRDRVLRILTAVCDSLRARMGEIRNDRAAGLLSEVGKTVDPSVAKL